MNSTKILIITSEFPPQPGGIGNHAFHLAKSLAKRGKEVTVLTDIRSNNGLEEKRFDDVLPFKIVRIKRHKPLVRTYLNRIAQASKLIREHDTILISGKFSLFLMHWLWCLHKNRKWVAVVHGSELLLPEKRQMIWIRSALRRADRIIAVSNYTASLIQCVPAESITVIPNGHGIKNKAMEKAQNLTLQPLRLITIGNITERKGQQNVVLTLPKLLSDYPKLEYHVVGIPTEKDQLIRLAEDNGVATSIFIHGRVEDDEKFKLLRDSDIFMMLSQRTIDGDVEGFGIAILEANVFGVPAIGARGTGIEDAIKAGFSGELVDAQDPGAIVHAINKIIKNYKAYSTQSIQWAEKFRWDEIVSKYIEVLDR